MNVYDFDHTIYRGDSSVDFALYCLKRYPYLLIVLPLQAWAVILLKLKVIPVKRGKELFFIFLRLIRCNDRLLDDFWDRHIHKVSEWYLQRAQADDLIISASPEFLLKKLIVQRWNKELIGTVMDPGSGMISGENCKGSEKVNRLRSRNGDCRIGEFYSDSYSDSPLAELAEKSYLIALKKDSPPQLEIWQQQVSQ